MEYRRELAAAVLYLAFALPAWTQPAKRALLIANSAYRSLPALSAPRQNVEAIAPALAELGFQVSPIQHDLNQAGMIAATRRFTSGVQQGDTVYLFFSGYGMAEESTNYLLPVDFNPAGEGPIVTRALQIDRLLEQLEERKAGVRIIVIDASRECTPLMRIAAGRGLAAQQGVPASTLLFFPAQPGDTAKDPPAGAVSPFVQTVLREMKKPGRTAVQVFSDITEGSVIARGVGEFYFTAPLALKERIVQVEVAAKLTPGATRESKKDGSTYAYIPPGQFQMGCVPGDPNCADKDYANESPRHAVKIGKAFWMSRTEVTVGEYDRYLAEVGDPKKRKTSKVNPGDILTDHPVIRVTWDMAGSYCKWAGGRLPTEAEWEYAARAGQAGTLYTWGNEWNPEAANSFENSRKKGRFNETTPVRHYKEPNAWGLYDMSGNAREWVSDTYNPRAYDRAQPVIDPHVQQPSPKGEHVIRGGSYGGKVKELRISARQHWLGMDNQTGFRCVLPEAALK